MSVPFQPQRGDFGLAKGGGLVMAAVRLGTLSRYGHACICESVHPSGGITAIEPMPSGCRRRLTRPGEFVWSDVALTDDQRTAVVAYADTTIGLPYDWPAIWRFVGRFWKHRLHLARRRRLGVAGSAEPGGESLICSELPTRAYRLVGVDMAPGKPADSVSPGDLRQWLDDRRRAVNRRA
jgi:hypothetical protein